MRSVKKTLLSVVLAAVMILSVVSIYTVNVSAGTTAYPAADDDAIQSGEAEFEVGFLETSPEMDGVIGKDEYYEVPFDAIGSYFNFVIGDKIGDWTPDLKHDYLLTYIRDKVHYYSCWDGKYFYFAVSAEAPLDEYTCPEAADSVNLFRYWCAQFGFAADGAGELDRMEVGLGASSDNIGDVYSYDAWGTRYFNSFVKGKDYYAYWTPESETVVYEIRCNIKEVIGENAQEGSVMRFMFLLSQCGQYTLTSEDFIQIQCGMGCAQGKDTGLYLKAVMTGVPEGREIETDDEDIIVEEELDGFWGRTDFRKADVVALIDDDQNVIFSQNEDPNGDKYVHVVATGDEYCYIGGKKIPVGMNADVAKWIAIRYRTDDPRAVWMGFSYLCPGMPDISEDYLMDNLDELICDGQWHTAVIDMTYSPYWNSFVTNMRIWLFSDQRESVKNAWIDIMWLKYYTEEPDFGEEIIGTLPGSEDKTDIEPTTDDDDGPAAETVADLPPEGDVTADVNGNDVATVEESTADAQNAGDEQTADQNADGKTDSGCASSVGVTALASVVIGLAALHFCKSKKHD